MENKAPNAPLVDKRSAKGFATILPPIAGLCYEWARPFLVAIQGSADRALSAIHRGTKMRKSAIVKHSIIVSGRKTSVSLESAFWMGLKEIAALRNSTLSGLVTGVCAQHHYGNLSSALRLFVLDHFRAQALRHNAAISSRLIGDPANEPTARAG